MRSESRWPQIGILLLVYELFASIGLNKIPPVTLGAIGLQIGIFLKVLSPYLGTWTLWSSSTICLNANVIMKQRELYRIFTAPIFHGSDLHLYYNMVCQIDLNQNCKLKLIDPNTEFNLHDKKRTYLNSYLEQKIRCLLEILTLSTCIKFGITTHHPRPCSLEYAFLTS